VYIQVEFKGFETYKSTLESLEGPLKQLILCDRYNKQEPVTENLDFTAVRNVLHKFNTRYLLEFFGQKENAFLYMFYYESRASSDVKLQKDVDEDKLIAEMKTLYKEAEKYVKIDTSDFLKE